MLQARAVIDLSTFETIRPVDTDRKVNACIASQSYIARGSVTDLANELKSRLVQAQWRPLDGGAVTTQYASEVFQKSGFTLSLTVMPSPKPNESHVTLTNHGNVDYTALPLPDELKPQYQSAVMSMFSSPWSVEETTEKLSSVLVESGWQPYGAPIGSRHFKQNGVRLMVNIMAAPAQGNQTVVQITSEQLSADLPVPDGAEGVQYSDSTRQVLFDSAASVPDVFASVAGSLAPRGWKQTTESLIKIDFREHLIFRDGIGDMIEVVCYGVEEKTRCTVQFKSAAEVEALDQAVETELARRKKEMEKQAIKAEIPIAKPIGSTIVEADENSIEFSLPVGKAKAMVASWLTQFQQQGWKLTTNANDNAAGDFELVKGEIRIHITYVDPSLIPASLFVSVTGKATLRLKP